VASIPLRPRPASLFQKTFFWITAVILFLALILILCWPVARTYVQSAAILSQLNGQSVPRWAMPWASRSVLVSPVELSSVGGPVAAKLYTPAGLVDAPGVVLVPGIHYLGIDEPRLIAFARSIAACGYRVLTPELPGSREYRIQPDGITAIGTAVQWLAKTTGRRVGIIGLSFSGGLALMAASKSPASNHISAVLSVGAHDDLYRVAMFYASHADPLPNGDVERVVPSKYGPWVLEYEHLEDFVDAADIDAIRPVLRARLHNDAALENTLEAHLTPAQKEQYAKIVAVSDSALALSNEKHIAEMAALSPHGHLAGLHAPVYLLHGRGDDLVPFAESDWLALDLPSGTLRENLVTPLIGHVNTLHQHASVLDRWRLLQILARVLQQVERG
jgi:dienelactone hydrolase